MTVAFWTVGILLFSLASLLLGYYVTQLLFRIGKKLVDTARYNTMPRPAELVILILGLTVTVLAYQVGFILYAWDIFVNHFVVSLLMWDLPRRTSDTKVYGYTVTLRFKWYRSKHYRTRGGARWRTWVAAHLCDCWLNWADHRGYHC